ncbi:MAG: DUF3667 domain-containing protein [Bacteroidota bacterium]
MQCKNCGHELKEEDDYCPNCGARVIRNRLTIKSLFHHISETYFNYDNKLLRTFLLMFSAPDKVVGDYIGGIRKRYVDVISYFALALTLSGIQIFLIKKFGVHFEMYDGTTELGRTQNEFTDKIFQFTSDYQSIVMMMYVPFYAIIARLVFWKYKQFNFTELLVFFLYTQAHFSICSALIIPFFATIDTKAMSVIGIVILVFQFLYFIYALKKFYQLTGLQMMLRTLKFMLIMFVLFTVMTIIVAFYLVKTGAFDRLKDA